MIHFHVNKEKGQKNQQKMKRNLAIIRQVGSVLGQHLCCLMTFTAGPLGSSNWTRCLLLCFIYLEKRSSEKKADFNEATVSCSWYCSLMWAKWIL